MQAIYSKLDKSEAVYERFKMKKKEDHVVLYFGDADEDFGYLRTAVGTTLSTLLAKSYVEFEPIAPTSYLMDIIGRANKPSEAIVKVDINIYGPQRAGTEIGNELSHGKLWLQKSAHKRYETAYENPHFLRLKTNGAQLQIVQPAKQIISEGSTNRKNREERLRKMVEEVYKSVDRTRHLDMVEGGERVTQKLLKYIP